MAKIITPHHKFPAEKVAISASQNVYKNQRKVDEKEARAEAYGDMAIDDTSVEDEIDAVLAGGGSPDVDDELEKMMG